ncbi:hypothetical protein [Mucilaginibacter calamicampi]
MFNKSSAMTKKIFILLMIACCLGCKKRQTEVIDCPAKMCTLNFASITVQFQDKDGNVITVKDFTVVNQRTKENLTVTSAKINDAGDYMIVHDGMRSKLSSEGDDIVVTATNPTNGQTKTATYKISGGCSCHVYRISGPQVIKFD